MENNEDQIWLDSLAGKSVTSKNKKIILEAKLLRGAIQKNIAEEKAFEDSLVKLHARIQQENLYEKLIKRDLKDTLQALIAKFKVTIMFILGLIAGAMIPMELARNSENLMFQLNRFSVSDELIGSEISLIANSPKSKTDEIVNMGISNNLEVKVRKNQKDGFTLTIYGLERNNVDQVALKSLIGISNQSEGVVKIIISAH